VVESTALERSPKTTSKRGYGLGSLRLPLNVSVDLSSAPPCAELPYNINAACTYKKIMGREGLALASCTYASSRSPFGAIGGIACSIGPRLCPHLPPPRPPSNTLPLPQPVDCLMIATIFLQLIRGILNEEDVILEANSLNGPFLLPRAHPLATPISFPYRCSPLPPSPPPPRPPHPCRTPHIQRVAESPEDSYCFLSACLLYFISPGIFISNKPIADALFIVSSLEYVTHFDDYD
jgi:hypothetical protein